MRKTERWASAIPRWRPCAAGCGVAVVLAALLCRAVAAGAAGPAGKPVADPANALWTFEISGVAFGNSMQLHMATVDGKVVRAFGLGSGRGVHTVDASGLTVSPTSLKGRLSVTANPDQWFPKDGQPVESRIELDALIRDGRLGGTYKGKRGGEDASGMIVGTLRPTTNSPPQGTLRLELERAVEGPVVEQRACLIIVMREGKVSQVTAAPRDPRQWKGVVTAHSLSVSAEAISGQVTVQVNEPLDVKGGAYTFTLDGKVVGSVAAGTFRSTLGDREVSAAAMFSGKPQ